MESGSFFDGMRSKIQGSMVLLAAFGGREVITPEIIREVYGIEADVIDHGGQTVVIPCREQPQYDDIVGAGVGGHRRK